MEHQRAEERSPEVQQGVTSRSPGEMPGMVLLRLRSQEGL